MLANCATNSSFYGTTSNFKRKTGRAISTLCSQLIGLDGDAGRVRHVLITLGLLLIAGLGDQALLADHSACHRSRLRMALSMEGVEAGRNDRFAPRCTASN